MDIAIGIALGLVLGAFVTLCFAVGMCSYAVRSYYRGRR